MQAHQTGLIPCLWCRRSCFLIPAGVLVYTYYGGLSP